MLFHVRNARKAWHSWLLTLEWWRKESPLLETNHQKWYWLFQSRQIHKICAKLNVFVRYFTNSKFPIYQFQLNLKTTNTFLIIYVPLSLRFHLKLWTNVPNFFPCLILLWIKWKKREFPAFKIIKNAIKYVKMKLYCEYCYFLCSVEVLQWFYVTLWDSPLHVPGFRSSSGS